LGGVPDQYHGRQPYQITVTLDRPGMTREVSRFLRASPPASASRQAGSWRALDDRVQIVRSETDSALLFVRTTAPDRSPQMLARPAGRWSGPRPSLQQRSCNSTSPPTPRMMMRHRSATTSRAGRSQHTGLMCGYLALPAAACALAIHERVSRFGIRSISWSRRGSRLSEPARLQHRWVPQLTARRRP
jgi:hypothetical protein